jgi:hypothetical protein
MLSFARQLPSAHQRNIMLNPSRYPVLIGLVFGSIGIVLTLVGIARGNVPAQPASIAIALLIGGGVWFLVAWAVATAARDVEQDLQEPPS